MKYKLNDIDKKQTFKVPEGYFEELPLKIQSRINEEQTTSKTFALPAWSVVLAASILLVLTFVFILPNNEANAEELLASVSQDELIAYLDHIELDEYEIASAIDDTDEIFEYEDPNVLDGIDISEEGLDDMILEYDLEDEYL